MMLVRATFIAALLVATIGAARAQSGINGANDVTGTDRATLSACLRENLASPAACIGSIAVTCSRTTEGEKRDHEVACARRETAVWRERLDISAVAYSQKLESASKSRFVALHRSWESYTSEKCAFFGDTQPPAISASMQAGCSLREVATRANEIERALRGKTAVSNRSANPPRIER